MRSYILILLAILSSTSIVAQASNDDCSGAIAIMVDSISCVSGNTSITNIGATISGYSSSCPRYPSRDIWYSFTVPTGYSALFLKLFSLPSGTMVRTEIFDGSCGNLTSISCQYYFGSQFRRIENLQENNTYYIRFYENDDENFNSYFCLFTPPLNEVCDGAISVSVDEEYCISPNVVTNFPIANRSTQGVTCGTYSSSDRDLWYEFSMPSNRKILHINNSVVGASCSINIYKGTCGSLSSIHCLPYINSPTTNTIYDLESDSTYFLRIDRTFHLFPDNEFCLFTTQSPINDFCESALQLTPDLDFCQGNINIGNNKWANDSGEQNCGAGYSGGDVWYEFTVPSGRYATYIDLTQGIPNGDLYVSVYKNKCDSLVQELCSNEVLLNSPKLLPNLLPDSTYFLRFFEKNNDAQDTFKFCFYTTPPPPSNNWCNSAALVNVGLDSCQINVVTASNIGASDSGEINICGAGNYNGGDIWYEATVPAGRIALKVDMLTTSGNQYLEVYENTCGSLNSIYCSDALSTSLDEYIYFLNGSQSYLLRFFEDGFDVSGTFDFCVYAPPLPPPNDSCAGAIVVPVDFDSCSTTIIGNNTNATDSDISLCNSYAYFGGDLWYEFTMPSNIGEVTYNKISGPGNWYFDVFKNDCDNLTYVDCVNNSTGSSRFVSGLQGDSTYKFRIFEYGNNNIGNTDFCLTVQSPPSNNDCASALNVNVDECISAPTNGTNISASDSGEVTICGSGTYLGNDIWYSFNLPSTETSLFIDLIATTLSNGNLHAEIYSGTCGNLVVESCSQSINGNPVLINGLTGGNSYLLRIFESGNDRFGDFSFNLISGSLASINNNPTTAEIISIDIDSCATAIIGTNMSASDSGVENPGCGSGWISYNGYSGGDLWYNFTTPSNASSITIDFSSMPGTIYGALYSSDTVNVKKLRCLNSFSTSSNKVVSNLPGNTEFLLRLYELQNNNFGCFEFCIYSELPDVFTVNTSDDVDDGVCDSVHCSFREAIIASNNDGVESKINFNIPGAGPHQINIGSGFPEIKADLVIDATTQPNWSVGSIVIDASGSGLDYFNGNYYASSWNPGFAGEFPLSIYGLELLGKGVIVSGGSVGAKNKENQFHSDSPLYIENVISIQNNFFDGGGIINGSYSYLYNMYGAYVQSSGSICDNYFYDNARIELEESFVDITYNKFGIKPDGTVTGGNDAVYGIDPIGYSNQSFGSIRYNEFHELNTTVFSEAFSFGYGYFDLKENTYHCNLDPDHNNISYNNYTATQAVSITSAYQNGIYGTSTNFSNDPYGPGFSEEVFIYLAGTNCNNGEPCQGIEFLGMSSVDPLSGGWSFNYDFVTGDNLVAYSEYYDISGFQSFTPWSSCYVYTPPTCSHAIGDTVTFVTNTHDSGIGSLRNAIECANYDTLMDYIHFNIPGNGPFNFNILSPLPDLLDSGIVIDGSTQPGYNSIDYLQVDQTLSLFGSNHDLFGLQLESIILHSDNCTIGSPGKGNLISYNNTATGLIINSSNNKVQSNYFGVDATGTINSSSSNSTAIEIGSALNYGYNYLEKNSIGGSRILGEGNVFGNRIINNEFSSLDSIQGNNIGIGSDDLTVLQYIDVGIIQNERSSRTLIGGITDKGNYISNCGIGIEVEWPQNYGWAPSYNRILGNKQFCNATGIKSGANPTGSRPVIDSILPSCIKGLAEPFDIVEVFKNRTTCTGAPQGDEFLGQVAANSNGVWECFPNTPLEAFDEVVATATKPLNGPTGVKLKGETSNYSIAEFIQPDDCVFAQYLTVNKDECATTGIVLDLLQMTASSPAPVSSYVATFSGNDAWYKVETPPTGNFLVRTNLTNTVAPILEGYTGTCGNLIFQDAFELDSIPYALSFENYSPGSIVYLRVWDRNNSVVSSGASALLHLTAHELPIIKDDWEICDQENNLINGNPTILSERDANSFIVEYEDAATLVEIQNIRDSLIAGGGTLIDSCLCGSNPIELWDHSTPIEMEENKRGARLRARVDTSNYNYIFEQREFQVNSYAIGEQYECDVSMNNDADFVIAWTDLQRRNNYGRWYYSSGNPKNEEFLIGSNDKSQSNSSVYLKDDGEFIVVYQEIDLGHPGAQYSIGGKEFYRSTQGVGPGIDITALASQLDTTTNSIINSAGINPKISGNSSGKFVVVWNDGPTVLFQRFDQSFFNANVPVIVDTTEVAHPSASIAMKDDDGFVITWISEDSDLSGIFAQLYSNNGIPIGAPFQVNIYSNGIQSSPDIDVKVDGTFTIVWESYEQEGPGLGYGIYARRFNASGQPIDTSEFLVNSYTSSDQKRPSISVFDDGRLFIAWSSYGQDGDQEGVYGKFFGSNGVPIGTEFQLNTFTDNIQELPATSTDGNSITVGVWEDGLQDNFGKGIFGQRYEIINPGTHDVFYPIGTATPYTKLGDELTYPGTIYSPTDSLASVRVAIIDTGVDPNHPYLSSAIWNNQQVNAGTTCYVNDTLGYDFVNDVPNPIDYDGHGTKVNGIIARDFPADIQLELMNLKFHEFQKGKVFDAVCAIYYAVDNGADIINMSWGFEASEYPAILKKAIQYASDNDVLLITTAGNTSKDNDKLNKFPCNLDIPHMIRVTSYEYKSSSNTKKLANYASYGKNNVDIAAYGFVETPTLGDTLELASGTSLAAPHITRTAAIIKGLFPNLTAQDIKDCILNSAEPESELSNVVATGGILDHDAAINCAYDKAANCVAIDLYITIPQQLDTVYRSDVYVETDAEINSNADVEMWGAEYVKMLPGFETTLGTEYLADIDDCDPLNTPNTLQGGEQEQTGKLRLRENSVLSGKIKVQFYSEGQEQEMKILDASGKEVKSYTFAPTKQGWYEKIIDAKLLSTGVYKISLEGNEKAEEKLFQVQNAHYERYMMRARKGAEE